MELGFCRKLSSVPKAGPTRALTV
jgi:membrane-associated phospholipid phosphatase